MTKSYSEMMTLPTYGDRLLYLQLQSAIGTLSFGEDRWVYQKLLASPEWKRFRDYIVTRDNGADLGDPFVPIVGPPVIHHIVPVTIEMILSRSELIFDPNNVISCSDETHKQIHYGHKREEVWTERRPFDTCPWKSI